jgi:O-antigen ligase
MNDVTQNIDSDVAGGMGHERLTFRQGESEFSTHTRSLAGLTAAIVTTAAFAKTFVPFYLIGSTAIFAAACAIGAALVIVSWRPIYDMAGKVTDILLLLGALYGLVIINFLFYSRPAVPMTHLLGILIFHALFMIFGFSAARALKAVFMMLLGAAAIYLIVIAEYSVRFGDLMKNGRVNDIFGVGDPVVFITFHQNIGIVLGLGALAALGLASNRLKQIPAIGALPLVLAFMFYTAARGAMVALVCSLMFRASADFWARSKKLTLLGVASAVLAMTLASGLFYQRSLRDKDIDVVAPDAISRTIREMQDPRPGFRTQIWSRAWHHILTEPDQLLFGRGIGMYPVHEGYGAPDWLLRRTEAAKHYPHNVYLEMLYETGIAGLLLFVILTLSPLAIALRRWNLFSNVQKSAISMYVFQLAGSQFSGAFAFGYLDQFFFAITVGIIALKPADDLLVSANT